MCSTSSTSSASAAGPRSRRGCSPASPGSRRPPAQNISTGPTYRYRRIRPGIGRTLCGVTTTSMTVTERRRLTAIRAAWLFDGTSTTLMPDPTVVLDGTTIVAVGPSAPVPDGAIVVDLAGATLLPGLIDAHVHLAFDASDDPVGHLAGRDDAAAFAAMPSFARCAARGGVTTVRDLGDRGYLSLGVRRAAATDSTLPEILASGPPITTPRGHCHLLREAAHGL